MPAATSQSPSWTSPANVAFSLELAERKAYTSALVGVRTADLVPLVQPGRDLYPLLAVSGGRFSAIGGGVPVTSEGQVVAGVGVNGGTTEQDIAIVENGDEMNARGFHAQTQLYPLGRSRRRSHVPFNPGAK
jgi:uncharacterized protein GlcG (DUF336 family)